MIKSVKSVSNEMNEMYCHLIYQAASYFDVGCMTMCKEILSETERFIGS